MTAHIFHPDVHTYGLCPECPRCQEHAAHPEGLDTDTALLILSHPISALDHEARSRLLAQRYTADQLDRWLHEGDRP